MADPKSIHVTRFFLLLWRSLFMPTTKRVFLRNLNDDPPLTY